MYISFKSRDSYLLHSQVEKYSLGISKTKRMLVLAVVSVGMCSHLHDIAATSGEICCTISQFTCCSITALMLLLCHHGRDKVTSLSEACIAANIT